MTPVKHHLTTATARDVREALAEVIERRKPRLTGKASCARTTSGRSTRMNVFPTTVEAILSAHLAVPEAATEEAAVPVVPSAAFALAAGLAPAEVR